MSEKKPTAPVDPEAKERFRQALEAKKAESHRTEQARRDEGAIHGSETVGTGRRMFRRKSG